MTYGPYGPQVEPADWFAALAEQSQRLTDVLAEQGREPDALRRIVRFGLDVQWPFESAARYADTLGRLAGLNFDEVAVHWSRPEGRGVPAHAVPFLAAAHGL